ncbi:hypothetical protein GCK32_001056 [Trichostrongylus colubriformis]|uniref:Uncharacterized protein n=1 Tax=Trichostrongylus colubriformis TaxID=6319 RepID=A0AAN8FNE0_TRICO
MEIVAIIIAVVIIFQLIFVCKDKTRKNVKSPSRPKSKSKTSSKTKSKSISSAKGLETPAKTALLIDDKEDIQKTALAIEETQQPKQSLDETEVSPPKQAKGKPKTLRAKQAKTKRTVEGQTQDVEVKEEAGTQPQRSDVNVAAALKKSSKSKKQVLSNPIVTPVTDEFPTENENDSKKHKTDRVEMKTAPEKRIVRKDGQQVADYKSKKKKRGKDRNMSDPIVTPCTDEFPTDEEKAGLTAKEKGNANKAAA